MSISNWERRGSFYFQTLDGWHYMIHMVDNGRWRIAERCDGDRSWETITHCQTLEEAMATPGHNHPVRVR